MICGILPCIYVYIFNYYVPKLCFITHFKGSNISAVWASKISSMVAALLACSKLSFENPAARSVMLSQVLSQLRYC